MRLGLVGASGKLGRFVAEVANRHTIEVTPIDSHMTAEQLCKADRVFNLLDVILVVAPLESRLLHKMALENGCHVIDVGIDETNIEDCLALEEKAKLNHRSLVFVAGLAPGLTGLIGRDMAESYPGANFVDVTLVQSVNGSAGKRGVFDMLDMLTDKERAPITNVFSCETTETLPTSRRSFKFPTAEEHLLHTDTSPVVRYHTRFDSLVFNRLIDTLRIVRGVSLRAYRTIRNRAATAKAKKTAAPEEVVKLCAVATNQEGGVLGQQVCAFTSDYEATAATAIALANLAHNRELKLGAGHPANFTDWKSMRAQKILDSARVII